MSKMKPINFHCLWCGKRCDKGRTTVTFEDHIETTRECSDCGLAWRISLDFDGHVIGEKQVHNIRFKKDQLEMIKHPEPENIIRVVDESTGYVYEAPAPTLEESLRILEEFFG